MQVMAALISTLLEFHNLTLTIRQCTGQTDRSSKGKFDDYRPLRYETATRPNNNKNSTE